MTEDTQQKLLFLAVALSGLVGIYYNVDYSGWFVFIGLLGVL